MLLGVPVKLERGRFPLVLIRMGVGVKELMAVIKDISMMILVMVTKIVVNSLKLSLKLRKNHKNSNLNVPCLQD